MESGGISLKRFKRKKLKWNVDNNRIKCRMYSLRRRESYMMFTSVHADRTDISRLLSQLSCTGEYFIMKLLIDFQKRDRFGENDIHIVRRENTSNLFA